MRGACARTRTCESNCAYDNALRLSPSPFGRELGALRACGGVADGNHLKQHPCSVITHVARPLPSARPQTLRSRWRCKRAATSGVTDGSVRLVGRTATNTNRWISRVYSRRSQSLGALVMRLALQVASVWGSTSGDDPRSRRGGRSRIPGQESTISTILTLWPFSPMLRERLKGVLRCLS